MSGVSYLVTVRCMYLRAINFRVIVAGRRRNLHVRDSPGPRERSTANITCGTSKVGSGTSGSTSSSSLAINPGEEIDEKIDTEDVRGWEAGDQDREGSKRDGDEVDVRFWRDGGGEGVDMKDNNPVEKDDDLL